MGRKTAPAGVSRSPRGTRWSDWRHDALAILRVLWDRGPSTVRHVNEALSDNSREIGYTTTLKLMQIMAEKGLVTRDESGRCADIRLALGGAAPTPILGAHGSSWRSG
jgi:hypothetical protein